MDFTNLGLLQLLIVLFALFALTRVILRYREKQITTTEFLLWIIIWISLVIVSAAPELLSLPSRLLGIGRGVDVIIYLGLIGLFYLVFRLFVNLENQKRELTKLVREIALMRADPKEKVKRE